MILLQALFVNFQVRSKVLKSGGGEGGGGRSSSNARPFEGEGKKYDGGRAAPPSDGPDLLFLFLNFRDCVPWDYCIGPSIKEICKFLQPLTYGI